MRKRKTGKRKSPEVHIKTWGIYSQWDRDSKALPQILERTTRVEAVVDVEFGMVVNIIGAKNMPLDFCIDHPGIRGDKGKVQRPFDGTVFVKTNDWDFYLGDTIWLPIDDKLGNWRMTLELDGELVADKTFELIMPENQPPNSNTSSEESNRERDLVEAIKNGDASGVATILDSFDDQQEVLSMRIGMSQPTNHAIGSGATLLQFASYRPERSGDVVSVLLDRGAEVDIHSASGLGMTDRIEEILSQNPDLVSAQVDTYFPIQYAITAKKPESVECLLKHGDDPNRDLKKVAYFGWEDDHVASKYTPWKPIHMASLYGFDASRVPVVEALAKHGADLNAVSPLDGYRPIHLVAMPNRVDMIRFFVSQGVDVDSRTEQCNFFPLSSEDEGSVSGLECTPLMVTCGEGFVEAAQCLIELGADVNARNSEGKTALDFASKRFWNGQPYDEVIKVLKANGAS